MTFASIDTSALFEVIWVSLAAAWVIIGAYSVGLYGSTRYLERRHQSDAGRPLGYAVVAAAGYVVFVAAVVVGFILMVSR
jgi:uncharacterized membrane protein YidH (DUF202 family)